MRRLIILISVLSCTTLLNAQTVEIAYYHVSQSFYEAGHYSIVNDIPTSTFDDNSKKATTSNDINLYDFKRFDFFKEMIAQSSNEDLNIYSFRIIKVSKRKDAEIQHNHGCKIQDNILKMVRNCTKGDQYYITDVVVICPDGQSHSFPYTAIAQVK